MTVIDEQLLPPDEAFESAVAQLEEMIGHAEQAQQDGMQYPESVLGNATGRMAAHLIGRLCAHRPVYKDGAWVCMSCVELSMVGYVSAAAPCAEARTIFEMLGVQLVEAAPGGLQLVVQDGTEPYVSLAAAALENMHGLAPETSRPYASSVVRAITGFRARARR